VAIALRNRWRRQQVDEKLRGEITPKNILMIGPTGVGKTEIARRLAGWPMRPSSRSRPPSSPRWATSARTSTPSCATWWRVAVKQERERQMRRRRARAEDAAEERILDALVPPPRTRRRIRLCGRRRRRTTPRAR
jgi:ATP-dependent HslUV protease ATP-binding subunit HslU